MQEPTLAIRLRTSRSSLCEKKYASLGLDAQYGFQQKTLQSQIATILHFSKGFDGEGQRRRRVIQQYYVKIEPQLDRTVRMWLTSLLNNKVPTINATAPSSINVTAEFAQLVPHKQKSGLNEGSSYIDDFRGHLRPG